MSHCITIKHLQSIATGNEYSLANAAMCALSIISDIQEHGAQKFDIEILHSVVESVYTETGASLFDHLIDGAPDCGICAAIKAMISA